MALEIRMTLNDKQEQKFIDIVSVSKGNKTVVKNDLIEFALKKFHKKLCKPQSVLDNLASTKNE